MLKRLILATVLLTAGSVALADESCRAWFQALDYALAEAGVHDAGSQRIPGWPNLRSTRWLAFLQRQVANDDQAAQWLALAQEEARTGWVSELAQLSPAPPVLAEYEDWRRQVKLCLDHMAETTVFYGVPRIPIADSYADWMRVAGLYPITGTLARPSMNNYRADMARRFKRPARLPMRHYRPEPFPGSPPPPEELQFNPMEIPQPGIGAAQALLAHYAPVISVADTRIFNQPGAITFRDGKPAVDVERPTAYTWISWTRFRGHNLLQLNYQFWFSERPRKGVFDLFGGSLDSLIWRVTLKPDGNVLLYDSIHGCGCYHKVYPVARGLKLENENPSSPVIYPGLAPNAVQQSVSLVLEPDTHYVVRVEPFKPGQQLERYGFASADTLRALPAGNGDFRSLYNARGLIPLSARPERFLLWPLGVPSAGAMRQPGTHAIAFLGKRHFDDPLLLETIFQ